MNGLFVHRAGALRPGRRPLVLLHGWSCNGGFFEPQMQALGDQTLVLAPDLPGHGRSVGRVEPTIEAGADALQALLAEEDIQGAILVGWSMGALVAWSMIERHGADRLSALVVEDMSPKVVNAHDWQFGSRSGLDGARNAVFLKAIETQWPLLAAPTARRTFAAGASRDLLAFAEKEMRAADPASLAAMWRSLTMQDFRNLIPRLELPVVLAHGAQSQLYAAGAAHWQCTRLARARLHTFAASGHAPHLEEAGPFNAMLGQLIDPRCPFN
ncbi:alpha/beta fold hydrolase [Stappia sp.]|uniref:alpha/beta fold hydrolase n=1 Tax=Stappia sp. TaxID=1870903 RepID=UPI003A9A5D8A